MQRTGSAEEWGESQEYGCTPREGWVGQYVTVAAPLTLKPARGFRERGVHRGEAPLQGCLRGVPSDLEPTEGGWEEYARRDTMLWKGGSAIPVMVWYDYI